MRDLPALLRAAERRVNANVWPNTTENIGVDSHLASIPANRDTDTDLLLIEAADRIAALEARCRQYEEAFHKAFNQFENITVADTLEIAKERAHQMIGWAYASMPDYAPETGEKS